MTSFVVTGPDGSKYRVDGPEGATEQDALAQVQSQIGDKLPPGASGAFKAFDAGVASSVAGTLGAPRTLMDLGAAGIRAASDKVSDVFGVDRYKATDYPTLHGYLEKMRPFLDKLSTTEEFQKAIQDTFYGGEKPYEPQTPGEGYAKSVGEFAGMAIGGEGGLVTRAARVLAPAVTSETAGRVAKDTAYEPLARFLGAVVGGGAAAFLRPGTTRAALEKQLPQGVRAADVDAADALMQDAGARGVQLTWPEALSQVTQRPVMSNLMRHIEAAPQSEATMAEFYAPRPQQVEQAVQRGAEQVSPGAPMPPSTVGPAVGRAAGADLTDARQHINDLARPYYDVAEWQLASPQEMAGLRALPGWQEAARAVRGDPQLNRYVANLPENSVGFLNEVKKYLGQAAENATQPFTAQGRNMQRAAGYGADEAAVREAARRTAPVSYDTALGIESSLREQHLQPLLDGPLGALAKNDLSTREAINVLFPKAPIAHTEQEIGDAVRAVAARSPKAASDLVRAHIESTFDQAARDLQTGPNQAGGAKFRAVIAGSEQQRRNLQAAVEALPDGAARWQGFNRLLDVMEATGTRQNIGSRTAYNTEALKALGAGGAVETAAKVGSNPLTFLKPIADKYGEWRLGRNLNELAGILTDPRSGNLLRDIASTRTNSLRAHNIARALIYTQQPRLLVNVGRKSPDQVENRSE